jgi:hypothetical protein
MLVNALHRLGTYSKERGTVEDTLWALDIVGKSGKIEEAKDTLADMSWGPIGADLIIIPELAKLNPLMLREVVGDEAGSLIETFKDENAGSGYPSDGGVKFFDWLNVLKTISEKPDLVAACVKTGELPVDEHIETLLALSLSDEQRNQLVTWALETPGTDIDTTMWASKYAGNLAVEPRNGVKLRKTPSKRRDTGEGVAR